ncbi:MAG: PAS domain S-box protein [Candidatus Omnitrophica bacterium]|nr:PAS domain S-box protein [Candidatus Omnitrophota bacterium]MBU1997170.1 PAS domain S-box protein [Candidatus Omnitrophota bacterium]
MKDSSSKNNKRPTNKPPSQISFNENMLKHFGLNKLALILAAFSVGAAVLISTFSYQKTINDALNQYYIFYSKIAGMIAVDIGTHSNMSDNEIVNSLESEWKTIKNRPSDEYLCVVNKDSKLLLHTSFPRAVGDIVAQNLLLDKSEQTYCSLGDLVKTQKEYVGGYISSSGDAQIAAFAPVPQKKWVVGVHRSKETLLKEINSGLKPVFFSLIIICGILIPISFVLLYWTFIFCYRKGIHAEKALIEAEHSYRTIVNGTDDLITQAGANGLFTFVNHASNKIWGISPKECIGLSAFNFIHPEDQEKTKKAFEGWVSQKKKHVTYQNRQVNKNGQIFDMLWTINLEFNAAGEVVSVLNIAHDITKL